MTDLISYAISIAMYVLQALGLQAIAKRRGIQNAWLAWLPIGNIWVMASIADDFKQKAQGKQRKLRYWVTAGSAVTMVLSVVVLVIMFVNVLAPVMNVITYEDLMAIYEMGTGDSVSHMYAPAEEALMADIEARMEASMTEETLEKMVSAIVLGTGLSLLLAGVAIATAVMEYICIFNVFESCDPQNKVLYLVLSLLLGVQGIIFFLCREKDLGMAPSAPQLPGSQPENYWQQN